MNQSEIRIRPPFKTAEELRAEIYARIPSDEMAEVWAKIEKAADNMGFYAEMKCRVSNAIESYLTNVLGYRVKRELETFCNAKSEWYTRIYW